MRLGEVRRGGWGVYIHILGVGVGVYLQCIVLYTFWPG